MPANWLRRHWGALLLVTLVAAGLILATWHARDLAVFLEKGEAIADRPDGHTWWYRRDPARWNDEGS